MRFKDMTGIELADQFKESSEEFQQMMLDELEPHEIQDMRRFLEFKDEMLIASF